MKLVCSKEKDNKHCWLTKAVKITNTVLLT